MNSKNNNAEFEMGPEVIFCIGAADIYCCRVVRFGFVTTTKLGSRRFSASSATDR